MRSPTLVMLRPVLVLFSALLAVALLVKGHDQPGGGFVAGLALAIIVVLLRLSRDSERKASNAGVTAEALTTLALAGVAILLVSLIAPLLLGVSPLRHFFGTIEGPLGSWKWHTTLLFDVGVVFVVGGGVGAACESLWRRDDGEGRGS